MTFSLGAGGVTPAWRDRALERNLGSARARGTLRMERLVEAARELANETSHAGFTVAQVAARAGISLKGFYGCFHSKDELLLALLEDDSHRGAAALEELIKEHADAVAALHAFVTELFAMLELPGAAGYAGVLVREHRRLEEHFPDELRVALAPLVDLLAQYLARATDVTDARRDAETMFGVLLGGVHDVVLGRAPDARTLGTYLWEFCWNGLCGRAPHGSE